MSSVENNSKEAVDDRDSERARYCRRQICYELLSTEKTYVKCLKGIIKYYYEPCLKSKIASEDEIHGLFREADAIAALSGVFLSKIEAKMANYDISTTTICDCFNESWPEQGDSYLKYWAAYDDIQRNLTKLNRRDDFVLFTQKCRAESGIAHSLTALLSLPWESVARYQILFSTLLDNMPDSHPDYFSTTQAVASIDTASNYLKLTTIQKKLTSTESIDLVNGDSREFILEAECIVTGKQENRIIMIFTDMLLVIKKGNITGAYTVKEKYILNNSWLHWDDANSEITLGAPGHVISFQPTMEPEFVFGKLSKQMDTEKSLDFDNSGLIYVYLEHIPGPPKSSTSTTSTTADDLSLTIIKKLGLQEIERSLIKLVEVNHDTERVLEGYECPLILQKAWKNKNNKFICRITNPEDEQAQQHPGRRKSLFNTTESSAGFDGYSYFFNLEYSLVQKQWADGPPATKYELIEKVSARKSVPSGLSQDTRINSTLVNNGSDTNNDNGNDNDNDDDDDNNDSQSNGSYSHDYSNDIHDTNADNGNVFAPDNGDSAQSPALSSTPSLSSTSLIHSVSKEEVSRRHSVVSSASTSSSQSQTAATNLQLTKAELEELEIAFGNLKIDVFENKFLTVPLPLRYMIIKLYQEGPQEQGILRKSANTQQTRQVQQILNNGAMFNISLVHVSVCGALLKNFLRSLPESLLTSAKLVPLVKAHDIAGFASKLSTVKSILFDLPVENYELLHMCVLAFVEIAKNSDVNLMNGENIAICVGPSLIFGKEVSTSFNAVNGILKFILDNHEKVFTK